MSNNWLYNIRQVIAGEPVQASVVNRPTQALEDRTNYLKDRLDAAELGRALFDVDATIAPDVEEGDAVFWNYQTLRYERALAAVENDEITQTLVIQPSADCMGLLYKKKSPTLGDIVLRGIVKIPNLTNAIVGADAQLAGRYYLSPETPGKLVKQKPPVTVGVCYVQGAKDSCDTNPWVVVMPQVRDFLESHVHYRFELVPRIAGSGTVANGRHQINAPDATMQGWLPANHATFRRNPSDPTTNYAPPGALFGYNIKEHAGLARVWPPMPVQAVAMLWDKGQNRLGAAEIPLGSDGLAICDNNGIWWMSDCVGDVPWALDNGSSSSSSSAVVGECPRDERMRVIVVFLRMLFGNNRNVVTSLVAAPGSPITVANCDGLPAKTGDLELDLNLQLAVDPVLLDGGIALKRIDSGNKFRQGWVTEGVVSGSPTIQIQGYTPGTTTTRALTGAEKAALGFDADAVVNAQRGLVKITFNDQLVERELSPQIIRLSDVVERLYRDVPYLGFVAGQDSLVRVRFIVPAAGLGTSLQLKLRTQILGLATDTLPALQVTYRRLPRPGTTTQTPLVSDDAPALAFPSARSVDANNVIEVESSAFTVQEGDTVLMTIRRPLVGGGADGYSGEIGLLRMSGIITTGGT